MAGGSLPISRWEQSPDFTIVFIATHYHIYAA